MKRNMAMLALALVLCGDALAQRDGTLRGVFMKLAERSVDDRPCAALVVKPFTQDSHLEVLVPHEPRDLVQVARRLRPGHQVEIEFVLDGGHRWLRGLDAQWHGPEQDLRSKERIVVRTQRHGDAPANQEHERVRVHIGERKHATAEREPRRDRPRDPAGDLARQFEQLGQQFRRLADQVARMQREMRALRAENERLRRMLDGRRTRDVDMERPDRLRPERDRAPDPERRRPERRIVRERSLRDRPALPRLPDSLAGFKGVLAGKLVRKMDRGFVLKLERVTQVWEENEADHPEAALGKAVHLSIKPEQESTEQFLRTLRALKVGQDVLVEAFHLGGEHLTVVEQLKAGD